ncbi:MAG: response regulator [Clostridia bacterium]|nr:response regulator [Clostridia bacterium]
MEYSLVIADDDAMIRRGLSSLVDWDNLGFRLVGVCEDGQQLLDFIRRMPVNVVLTDISMPGLSGLDVAQAVKAIRPDCRFVILSGYSEFEYARSAVQLGIFDYLLKPVSPRKVEEIFTRLKETLDVASYRESRMKALEKSAADTFFQDALEGKITNERQLTERMNLAGLSEELLEHRVTLLRFPDGQYAAECARAIELMTGITLCRSAGNHLIVIAAADTSLTPEAITEHIEKLAGLHVEPELLRIYDSLLDFCLDRTRASSENSLVVEIGDILSAFESGNRSSLETAFLNAMCPDPTRRRLIFILDSLREWLSGTNRSGSPALQHAVRLDDLPTSADAKTLLEAGMAQLNMAFLALHREEQVSDPISDACAYLRAHCREELSLCSLAEVVHVSPVYLSRALKLKTGETFTAMLTRLRVEEAMNLLSHSSLPVETIAERSGFVNAKYFYKQFKHLMDVTPSEWRKRSREASAP